jgi:hypothetical protein
MKMKGMENLYSQHKQPCTHSNLYEVVKAYIGEFKIDRNYIYILTRHVLTHKEHREPMLVQFLFLLVWDQ